MMQNAASGQVSQSIRAVRIVFAVLASIFAAFVVVQVFFAGLATFVDAKNWGLHVQLVRYFSLLPLLLLILSFVGRLPASVRWQSLALLVMIILQFMTANMAAAVPYLSAVHPVIALGLFWTSFTLTKRSWKLIGGAGG